MLGASLWACAPLTPPGQLRDSYTVFGSPRRHSVRACLQSSSGVQLLTSLMAMMCTFLPRKAPGSFQASLLPWEMSCKRFPSALRHQLGTEVLAGRPPHGHMVCVYSLPLLSSSSLSLCSSSVTCLLVTVQPSFEDFLMKGPKAYANPQSQAQLEILLG